MSGVVMAFSLPPWSLVAPGLKDPSHQRTRTHSGDLVENPHAIMFLASRDEV